MFIEQAYKGENETWKFVITCILTMGIFISNLLFFLFVDVDPQAAMDDMMRLFKSKNLLLAFNLAVFIPILAVLFLLVWALHKRSILSLTTARKKVDWSRIQFSFMMVFIYTVVSFGIVYYMTPEDYVLQFDSSKFGILVLIGLVFFPFQIGLEEYLFRGYVMQQVGIMARNRWFPLVLTSVLFGIFHWANPEVAELGAITMVFYIGTGLLLGIMTLMDDGMELALGFHFGNNLLAATLLTYEYSALQTDAIFKSVGQADTGVELVLPVLIVYPIFLFILAKKYKWSNWKEKLTGAVHPPATSIS
ncbi:CPBP family intramembrane glutamic endopeptidase [Dokdonia sp. LLG6352-1]|uniref:CPBP family intramembrane glutamic endopeptidase n=1 Tax=Dokdonia sp. LLG6352-1 TaxID=3160831 RepID=UPI00386F0FFD